MRKFKVKIKEFLPNIQTRDMLIDMYNKIKSFKSIKTNNDKFAKKILQLELHSLRNSYRYDYATKFYHVTVSLGPHKQDKLFSWYPESADINILKNELMTRLRGDRDARKRLEYTDRSFNGVQYATVGGTFTGTNSVINLMGSDEYKNRIFKAKKPYDKNKYVGVELELVCSVDRNRLNELFQEAKLSGFVYVKHDGSIHVENPGEYEHEVTLIAKQDSIFNIIERVCSVLNSSEVRAYVNNSCGLHVHLDMRNRNSSICYSNLVMCLPILSSMVPKNRVESEHARRYCGLNKYNTLDEELETRNRYRAINAQSLTTHKTLEVRLHSGSTNVKKIKNWIRLLIAIVEKPDAVNEKVTIDTLPLYFNVDGELVNYINKRINKFQTIDVTTKQDNIDVA